MFETSKIKYILLPIDWPQNLKDIPPGPFVTIANLDLLCFKSEYHHDDGRVMAFNSAGEFFCGEGDLQKVIPVQITTD
ncbi:hypothetical protein LCGC14_0610470 [marine sediment metagenome]|uniref:Uncharacterized protein n=1 Tax=marine sediment metagenome TaxID=412755 RepID=A0A0F9UGB5_9ZZZZ